MIWTYWMGGTAAIALLVYLVVALLKPEKFA
jgi:K+-transporting ATPase KdpF subunit